MQVTEVKVQDGFLCLKVPIQDAMHMKLTLQPGDYDIVKHKKKRSKNANDFAWAMMTQIASKLRLPVVEVYRNEIRDISIKVEKILLPSEGVKTFTECFIDGHIARHVEVIDDDGDDAILVLTYGSSSFSRSEMTSFIDKILQDCRELGIETKDPGYIESLLEEWKPC